MQNTQKIHSLGQKLGLEEKDRQVIIEILTVNAANLQSLYIKTRGFHWNLEDARFQFLHVLFEDHYNALQEESDMVSERIRQLGGRASGSFKEFQQQATLREVTETFSGDEMIQHLVEDYETLIREMRQAINQTTNLNDFSTADMFTELTREFEKRAWMLRSHLVRS